MKKNILIVCLLAAVVALLTLLYPRQKDQPQLQSEVQPEQAQTAVSSETVQTAPPAPQPASQTASSAAPTNSDLIAIKVGGLKLKD